MTVPFDTLDEKDMITTLNEGTNLMNTLQEHIEENKNLLVNLIHFWLFSFKKK
jgi:hypothetical protein